MTYKKNIFRLLMLSALSACLIGFQNCSPGHSLQVTNLTVEGRDSLLGSDILQPRFSWKLNTAERDVKQTAYQILVSSSPDKLEEGIGDIWDSELITTDNSLNIEFNGKPFTSYQSCYWKVKVATNKGEEAWSEPAYWTIGLLDSADWKAKWIGMEGFSEKDEPDSTFTRLAARYLRKEFGLEKKIESATAFISGMGLYELYVNGEKAGNDVLTPTVVLNAGETFER